MKRIKSILLPLGAAVIWGFSFSAQSVCAAKGMGPFCFNMLRSVLALLTLIIPILLFSGGIRKLGEQLKQSEYRKTLFAGGLLCGLALFVASNLQQAALGLSASGKVGFITALYVILVPVLASFTGKKPFWHVWVSVLAATFGMYLLCAPENGGKSGIGDLLAAGCALVFAIHIMIIDRFSVRVNGVQLSFMQFVTMALLSGVAVLIFEKPSAALCVSCLRDVLYVGICSSGIAFTLQILAQKEGNPTATTLIMSLESVFALIGGVFLLHEKLSIREYIGCGVMLAAVVLAQIPFEKYPKRIFGAVLCFIASGALLLCTVFHWAFIPASVCMLTGAFLLLKQKETR